MANIDYPLYKIIVDPDSKKSQGFQAGDVVRREYFDEPNLIYSLMVVMETGVDIIGGMDSHYFIGALIEGDEPVAGELLDFVRITSLIDMDRGGALYLTASDSDAPYMDVIDGMGFEGSIAYPEGLHDSPTPGAGNKYGFQTIGGVNYYYTPTYEDTRRVIRLNPTSQSTITSTEKWGIRQSVNSCPANPAKLLISFRATCTTDVENVLLSFGSTDDSMIDGHTTINIGKELKYYLFVVSIDHPEHYERFFSIILTKVFTRINYYLRVSELNIVPLAGVSALAKGTKVRVGKMKGIVDPVFGSLDGYGAYFQNLYATRNVNIAGTLTAGDEKGFASTFYVGKIHKNAVLNSTEGEFDREVLIAADEKSPTGIGSVWKLTSLAGMILQDKDWYNEHADQWYCFSVWLKAEASIYLTLNVGRSQFYVTLSPDEGWKRYSFPFKVEGTVTSPLRATFIAGNKPLLVSSPQLEAGKTASQYQPTDGTLAYVEDYGAWFNKGGIGGTIQNPLLRLNEDGSISSRDESFVIYPDGTGHFSSGRFRWTKDTITLTDVTLEWESLSDEARENLKGEPGADGKDGNDGADGKDGEQGIQGLQGQDGRDGIDANLLDWVEEWQNGRTVITGDTLITPKIFTGAHNGNGTLTGTAIGRFSMVTRDSHGQFQTEIIDGIYGLKDGFKTFYIDNNGSVEFGRADNSIRYDADTGKIIFGAAVSMQWIGATYIDASGIFTGTLSADTVNAIRINASQINAGTISADRIDVATLKSQLITAENIEALTLNVVRGKIGCWSIDADSIFSGTKNNTANGHTAASGSITIGSHGIRGNKWRLESTGAGALAGGNIAWDIYGNVTFANSVSLYWINAASEALEEAKDYADSQAEQAKTDAVEESSGLVDAAKELAQAMAYGRMLYRDPEFYNGVNGLASYNTASGISNNSIARTLDNNAPNGSKIILRIRNTGTASPNCGGVGWATQTQYRKVFIARLIARIPVGRSIEFHTNSMGVGGEQKWLTSTAGTGQWQEYICKVVCGTTDFSSTHFFTMTGAHGTMLAPAEWSLAYATVFDITSSERLTTTIDANGIYTGTLTAEQVNAVDIDASSIKTGYLSADRIEAGSINADRLNAASIKADIINTDYISGMTLDFVQGTIGGWMIGADHITAGSPGVTGATPIQIRSAASGSSYWHSGSYKPYGISLLWAQGLNGGHLVFGQVAATASSVKTGFMGIQMMDHNGNEYFVLSANTQLSGAKEYYNRIAGWAFDNQKIWKGNVSLGSDGSITNTTKWKLNNDGSGEIAGGNISWDTVGNVTFSPAVAINWQLDINKGELFVRGSGYYNSTPRQVILSGTTLVSSTTRGLMLTIIDRATLSLISTTNYDVYGSDTNCNTLASVLNSLSPTVIVILTSYDGIRINANLNAAIQRCGGSDLTLADSRMPYAFIGIPAIGKNNGLTVFTGDTVSDPYAEISTKIINGLPEGFNAGGKQKTYIDGYGVYTGTLSANQVNAVAINASSITTGTLSAARIAAGSITVDKLDVATLAANLVTADNINALTLTVDKGTIGGWTIGSDSIHSNNIGVSLATAIQIRKTSTGSGYWYNGSYRPAGIALTWLYSSNAGHIVMGQVAASGNTVKTGYYGIQMMDYLGYEYFCISANTTSSTRTIYNRIAGWSFDHQQIYKNNVYLSSNGSIYNGTKWKFNNDGSGQIANGNIVWDSSGNVTFSASVALNWSNTSNGEYDAIIAALGGSTFPKLTYISSTGIYTGVVYANQVIVNSALVVGGSTYNGSVSVRNASNSTVVTLDRTGITAIAGKIGGWNITSSLLYAGSVYLSSAGTIYNGSYWRLNNDGSGLLAKNNIYWDAAGNITMKNATIQDVTIKGSIRAPFVRVDSSIVIEIGGSGSSVSSKPDSEKYDNLVIIGGQDSGGWNIGTPSLPWTVDQSGRRLCLTHYRYNSEYCYGTASFTAPSGKYFYENGRLSTTLKMSREVVELMGYGSTTTFFGWIVLNRRDLGTNSRYGHYTQYLAMGVVTATSSSCSIKYKTYDGTSMSVTRNGTGLYTVYMPWSLGATSYMVMMSGIWLTGPIYATIKSQSSSSFQVQTQDDSSANNGSFNFMIISTADFT